jgi:hypothetical protein
MTLRAAALALALGLTAPAAAAQEAATTLLDVAVEPREGGALVRIRTSATPTYRTEAMDGPPRLALDFADTLYRWKTAPAPVDVGPVKAVRGSQYRKGVARVVIELHRKAAHVIEEGEYELRVIFVERATTAPAPATARPAVPPPSAPAPPAPVSTAPAPPAPAAPPKPAAPAAPGRAPTPTPAAPAAPPAVYGIVLLDDEAVAYIADPASQQVRAFRVGDAVGGDVIEAITEREVRLRTPTGSITVRLEDPK